MLQTLPKTGPLWFCLRRLMGIDQSESAFSVVKDRIRRIVWDSLWGAVAFIGPLSFNLRIFVGIVQSRSALSVIKDQMNDEASGIVSWELSIYLGSPRVFRVYLRASAKVNRLFLLLKTK